MSKNCNQSFLRTNGGSLTFVVAVTPCNTEEKNRLLASTKSICSKSTLGAQRVVRILNRIRTVAQLEVIQGSLATFRRKKWRLKLSTHPESSVRKVSHRYLFAQFGTEADASGFDAAVHDRTPLRTTTNRRRFQ
jgi:hypothetical protein